MQRDPDLIRDLMLALEHTPDAELFDLPKLDGFTPRQVEHHFRLLLEAKLVSAAYTLSTSRGWLGLRLTWAGHEYLEQIRDPAIWKQTKKTAASFGSWSVETLGAIARAVLLAKLESIGIGVAS